MHCNFTTCNDTKIPQPVYKITIIILWKLDMSLKCA